MPSRFRHPPRRLESSKLKKLGASKPSLYLAAFLRVLAEGGELDAAWGRRRLLSSIFHRPSSRCVTAIGLTQPLCIGRNLISHRRLLTS